MRFPRSIEKSVARKLLAAVGVPSALLAAAGLGWLRWETGEAAPGVWSAITLGVVAIGVGMTAIHFVAVHFVVKRPLRALAGAMQRARGGEFLTRMTIRGEDELGQLAESFDATLRAITDLHVLRTDDALAMASMQRELALKAELERQHGLLDAANRELERRVAEMEVLAGLSQALNATLDVDAVCRAVADAVKRELGFTAFALLLVDAPTGDLVVREASGVDASAQGARRARGEGNAGLALQEKRVVVVRDLAADPRTRGRTWLPGGTGSLLAVPMIHQGECVGVLDFWRSVPDGFPPEETRFLQAVANAAAMAIANARLHEAALALTMTDPLTGFQNRRGLLQRLQRELDRAERFGHAFALALLDVDHHKKVLDAQGLVAADALLRAVAAAVARELSNVDTLARYRGDKFAVLLPRADRAAALEVAERLRAAVESSSFDHGLAQPGGRFTVSIGVASYPDDARDIAGIVDAADAALFAAKRAGRNAVRACAAGMVEDPERPRSGRAAAALDRVS